MSEEEIIPSDSMPEIPEPEVSLESLTPRPKSKLKTIAGAAVFLVLLATVIGLVFGKRNDSRTPSGTPTPLPGIDLSRYDEDPDGDRLPSFLEKKIGTDPNVSEVDACFDNRCNAPSIQEVTAKARNVIIVLDDSGSMREKVGETTKMESAKLAITEYLKKTATLPMTQVGLVIYGHKGSNQAVDKAVSCASAELIVPLSELKQETAQSKLAGIEPVGYTPIGLGIKTAAEAFREDKEKDKLGVRAGAINEIVVITDGVETCDTNPVGVAQELANLEEQITVHVIGFAVGSSEGSELRKIAEAGGGTYATAPTIDELKLAMDLQWENYVRKTREAACSVEGAKAYYACIDRVIALTKSYVSAELSRDPRQLPYQEKLKIDRIRWVAPSWMRGKLEDEGDFTPPSESAN